MVYAYDSNLVQTILSNLDTGKLCSATSTTNYAIFSGSTCDVYNSNLVKVTSLSCGAGTVSATSVSGLALFTNGEKIDVINDSLTYATGPNLSVSRVGLAATTVGNYALFGGGNTSGKNIFHDTVDVYTI